MRSSHLIVCLCCLAFSITNVTLAAPLYTITDLGTLGGDDSRAQGINNQGQVVGWAATSEPGVFGGVAHAFLWQASTGLQDLGAPSPYTYSYAQGINDNGQVALWADFGGGASHPFLWSAGNTMQDLGGGLVGTAAAINGQGQVVGQTCRDDLTYYSFLWQADTGMQDIGIANAIVRDINDNGMIVGEVTDQTGQHGFLRIEGGEVEYVGHGTGSRVWAANNYGLAVGASGDDGFRQAFLWEAGEVRNLGTLGGAWSDAYDINDQGQVIGKSATADGLDLFLWQEETGMRSLNGLIDPASGWTLGTATAINDRGQIVGSGRNSLGQYHAYLLSPVPEPSTLVLLAGMFGFLVAVYGRKHTKE